MTTKIFVNGTFDIIHRGHLELLNYARSLGDHLVVAIDSDKRVRELKGSSRPVNGHADRKYHLENLRAVDEVFIFDSAQALEHIIKVYAPDVMVKGSDYADKPIIGAEYCKEIKFYQLVDGYSTTQTIKHITNR
mgnify:CR=1 FL=1